MTLLKLPTVGRLLIRIILKVANEFHSLLVKIPVKRLARVQLSLPVSLKVIELPTTQVIELLAMVVVSLVTFAETAHQTQVISKLVRVTPQKMSSSAWMIKIHKKFMCCGSVNDTPVSTICRDTGCSSVIISDSILPDTITTNVPNVDVHDYLGRMDTFPVIKCYLRCPYYTGWGECYTRSH